MWNVEPRICNKLSSDPALNVLGDWNTLPIVYLHNIELSIVTSPKHQFFFFSNLSGHRKRSRTRYQYTVVEGKGIVSGPTGRPIPYCTAHTLEGNTVLPYGVEVLEGTPLGKSFIRIKKKAPWIWSQVWQLAICCTCSCSLVTLYNYDIKRINTTQSRNKRGRMDTSTEPKETTCNYGV